MPDNATQKWLFLGFFIAFAIKAPLVPFHTWLPDAGAEAPAGGAALLVGVLDKVGTFGFLRYCLPLFPDASNYFAPTILILSVIGILYAAFLAIGQRDMKRLVAYTSVAHFGFIGLGIFAFTTQGGTGAVLYMVNHGLSTGALFIVVGLLIARGKSRNVDDYGGAAKVTPMLAGLFLLAGLSALALPGHEHVRQRVPRAGRAPSPGTRGWRSWRPPASSWPRSTCCPLPAHDPGHGQREGARSSATSTCARCFAVAPLIALIIFLGVYPKPVLDIINPAVKATLLDVHKTDPAPQIGAVAGGDQVSHADAGRAGADDPRRRRSPTTRCSPILIVLGAALLGVLVEAFVPRARAVHRAARAHAGRPGRRADRGRAAARHRCNAVAGRQPAFAARRSTAPGCSCRARSWSLAIMSRAAHRRAQRRHRQPDRGAGRGRRRLAERPAAAPQRRGCRPRSSRCCCSRSPAC